MWQIAEGQAPPERHADRVIALMMRELARKQTQILPAIAEAILRSKDGGPRAQQRMADRIRAAGAVSVEVKTGTRGRYEMTIISIIGWDPVRNDVISVGDVLPAKPWIVFICTLIANRSRDIKDVPLLFVTHHALSRAAQRFEVRTEEDMIGAAINIWHGVMDGGMKAEALFNPPPAGHRIPVAKGVAVVIRKHEKRTALVAATVLPQDGENEKADFEEDE